AGRAGGTRCASSSSRTCRAGGSFLRQQLPERRSDIRLVVGVIGLQRNVAGTVEGHHIVRVVSASRVVRSGRVEALTSGTCSSGCTSGSVSAVHTVDAVRTSCSSCSGVTLNPLNAL